MAASGGRRVDKTEIPQNENLEVEVSEGHDNGDRRMNRGGVGDPKVKTECSNQLLDEEGLFAKATVLWAINRKINAPRQVPT